MMRIHIDWNGLDVVSNVVLNSFTPTDYGLKQDGPYVEETYVYAPNGTDIYEYLTTEARGEIENLTIEEARNV